jgi:hypothetical protein
MQSVLLIAKPCGRLAPWREALSATYTRVIALPVIP